MMASIFKIISTQNVNCDNRVGFPKSGHILCKIWECIIFNIHKPIPELKINI